MNHRERILALRSGRRPDRAPWFGDLPGIFSPLADDAGFECHILKTLELMARDGRMVLGVAGQVPPDGTWGRIARVAERVTHYG